LVNVCVPAKEIFKKEEMATITKTPKPNFAHREWIRKTLNLDSELI
jgi:hypothetical protein